MRGWRVCKAKYTQAALSGEGARRYGSRWNRPGSPMVYLSESLALAAIEFFVHLDPYGAPPKNLSAVLVEIPETVSVEKQVLKKLPRDWFRIDPPASTQDLGTAWLQSTRSCGLLVPSVLIQQESNILLNPLHPDFTQITIVRIDAFDLDPRLWKPGTQRH